MGTPYYIIYIGGGTENGKLTAPLRRFASLSSVALGSAPLRGYRSTFSASSKDPLRPPRLRGTKETGNGKREKFL